MTTDTNETNVRTFAAKKAEPGPQPLLIGLVGPPGGGKTVSALRLATGMKSVRPGPIVLIDTECQRSRKYAEDFDFMRVDFEPPFRSSDFVHAVRQQLKHKPCAIIIDTMSDEHEGEGGYLDFHTEQIPKMGGNEYAAWNQPSRLRQRMIRAYQNILAPPLLFTFRAREKTRQVTTNGKKTVINIGLQPVTNMQIMHGLDLTCILPPRAEGVPVWQSDKVGEDFVIKLPNFLKPYIRDKQQLDEEMGRAFALWASDSKKKAAAFPGAPPSTKSDEPDAVLDEGRAAATNGDKALREWWKGLGKADKSRLKGRLDGELKPAAAQADNVTDAELDFDAPADKRRAA